jgi:VIT1/CCC1 family predicted Fe2+/Mn2+ transporter
MADGTQFPPRPDYRAARATRLGTAIRATPSNLTAEGLSRRLNWLRAAVLGANDGIVSVAGHHGAWPHIHRWADGPGGRRGVDGARRICVGVESASNEKSLLAQQRRELREMPAAELDELAAIYEAKDVSPQTAAQVVAELTAHDALAAHVDAELRLDPDDLANPLQAAAASAASSTVGALLALLAILLPPATFRLPVTFVAVPRW